MRMLLWFSTYGCTNCMFLTRPHLNTLRTVTGYCTSVKSSISIVAWFSTRTRFSGEGCVAHLCSNRDCLYYGTHSRRQKYMQIRRNVKRNRPLSVNETTKKACFGDCLVAIPEFVNSLHLIVNSINVIVAWWKNGEGLEDRANKFCTVFINFLC